MLRVCFPRLTQPQDYTTARPRTQKKTRRRPNRLISVFGSWTGAEISHSPVAPDRPAKGFFVKGRTMKTIKTSYTPWYIEKDFGVISRNTERGLAPAYTPIYYTPIFYVPII